MVREERGYKNNRASLKTEVEDTIFRDLSDGSKYIHRKDAHFLCCLSHTRYSLSRSTSAKVSLSV